MPLSRHTRMDRRKKLILESAEVGRESTLRERRSARAVRDESELLHSNGGARRDAGYSQAVRHACQFRFTQLIPVRRVSLSAFVAIGWLTWAGLLFAHYWLFVRPENPHDQPAISHLLYLRSPYSIAQWLGTQLWFLTALTSLFIYLLRRHKLDDYNARYRLWFLLIAAAGFASLESSTSLIRLMGESIDTWSRSEVGYSGTALVLASFASVIGVLGLRLCSELKSAPASVAFWLIGLIAWGTSALFGTELLVLSWRRVVVDLFVGGMWLGGILSVWMSSCIYLRHTYVHAQKRMIARSGLLQPMQFQLPKMHWPLRRRESIDRKEDDSIRNSEDVDPRGVQRGLNVLTSIFRRRQAEPGALVEADSSRAEMAPSEKRRWLKWQKKVAEHLPNDSVSRENDEPIPRSLPVPMVQSQRVSSDHQGDPETATKASVKRRWWPTGKAKTPSETGAEGDLAETRKGWFKRAPKFEPIEQHDADARVEKKKEAKPVKPKAEPKSTDAKSSWFNRFRRSSTEPSPDAAPSPAKEAAQRPEPKISRPAADRTKAAPPENVVEGKRKGLFSFMDGLKLKPPSEESGSKPEANRAKNQSHASNHNNASNPSTTTGSTHSAPMPSTLPVDGSDPEDRNMTRAERKKMRREQNQKRAA